eukprot:TRINITY_DN41208_c0_g1_i1.p1 TRINITY_DN41208_c0_g1~~TRINITY_DN41208_c0_g1_i1.p1  ORF type:complete len:616 (-),score=134.30 TRINITY_DN41208_c0_g1_i1:34-1881(-)
MAARPAPRTSATIVGSALEVFADAAQRHAQNPGRFQAVVDRTAHRVQGIEELFLFCPSRGPLPVGGGTLWGLICESPPIISAILLRRLVTERLGDKANVDFSQRHLDAISFAFEEHPGNIALYEILARSSDARAELARRGGCLQKLTAALEVVKQLVAEAPSDRIGTDAGLVGKTSGIYGVRDSDAYYLEADLFATVLEVHMSTELQAFVRQGLVDAKGAAELRALCLTVADLADQLHATPRAIAKACAWLASAVPLVFQPGEVTGQEDMWTLYRMLLTSRLWHFVHSVLDSCCGSRMHDLGDIEKVQDEMFGQFRPPENRRPGRLAAADRRATFSHVVLLIFAFLRLRSAPAPPSALILARQADYEERVLRPALQQAVESHLASRWVPVRTALRALLACLDAKEVGGSEALCAELAAEEAAFRTFAVTKFLGADGALLGGSAAGLVDCFGHAAVATTGPLPVDAAASAAARELQEAQGSWRQRFARRQEEGRVMHCHGAAAAWAQGDYSFGTGQQLLALTSERPGSSSSRASRLVETANAICGGPASPISGGAADILALKTGGGGCLSARLGKSSGNALGSSLGRTLNQKLPFSSRGGSSAGGVTQPMATQPVF